MYSTVKFIYVCFVLFHDPRVKKHANTHILAIQVENIIFVISIFHVGLITIWTTLGTHFEIYGKNCEHNVYTK